MAINHEDITTRNDLVKFVEALAREASTDSKDWENGDLPSFLKAMAAWIEDMDGYYKNRGEATPSQPSWKTIGEILRAATIYEQ